MAQDKLVTTKYLNAILNKLYDWMPFKKNNGGIVQNSSNETSNVGEVALGNFNLTNANTILSIGIGSADNRKNAISICKDGQINIITNFKSHTTESLQHLLDLNGVSFANTAEEIEKYSSSDYLGKLIYLKESFDGYDEGLYIISRGNDGIRPFFIAESIKKELYNYYTKTEVEKLISDITLGDLSGLYYTKTEIDNVINNLDERIAKSEEFIDSPISLEELEVLTDTDINNDGNIGETPNQIN